MSVVRPLWILSRESFAVLKRDRVFAPALVMGLLVAGFAALASQWSVEDFRKILFDVGLFGLQATGGLVALVWGTKLVADSRQEGSLEVQLAAPVPRPVWLLGKFVGLAVCLALLGALLLAVWQGMMLLAGYGPLRPPELLAFGLMGVGWLVLAALALFFASMARQGVALFATLCAWVTGLAAAPVAGALGVETSALARRIVGTLARYWDLQQFNYADRVLDPVLPPLGDLGARFAYGGLLTLMLLTLACLVFSRRDVVG